MTKIKRYEAVLEEALEAARRLGMRNAEINAIRKALRPLTPQEQARMQSYHREHQLLRTRREELKQLWDSMTFAEWGKLRAAGKLPPTEIEQ